MARQRDGLAVFRVVLDPVAVEASLIEAGLLNPADCDDKRAVEAALTTALALLTASHA
jgi:hypothetical protein